MAGKDWDISDDVELLEKTPGAWNFFQAVRRIECSDKNNPRIGDSVSPDMEAVRFGQCPTLAFTPNDVHSYRHNSVKQAADMEVNCFGVLGSNGAIPLFLTEYIYQRGKHHNDFSLIDFVNMFQHRMTSFLYKAWAIFEPAVSADRDDDDYYLDIFKSLSGCNYSSYENRGGVDTASEAYYGGFLAKNIHSRGSLVFLLNDYFNVPVKLEELLGDWKEIDQNYLCSFGSSPEVSSLGEGMVMGEKYWDCKKKFRIKLGPMSYEKYLEFLPGRAAFKHLVTWVKKFNHSNFEWDLQLVLEAEGVKPCGKGTLMGYTGWMLSDKNSENREDLIIINPESKC